MPNSVFSRFSTDLKSYPAVSTHALRKGINILKNWHIYVCVRAFVFACRGEGLNRG